ncbi:hypothetical protein BDQ17DRAFT_1394015 [Cyathus striatus]|nr:hypothetical protein BDQ17DRAFT_1394015 [Cyathus striatus]
MCHSDKVILRYLKEKHMDVTCYGLGLTWFQEMCEAMGLFHSRKQKHDVDSIHEAMMVSLLFHEENMAVTQQVVISYFALYEPDLVKQWKKWWSAGVNDIIAVDQHDKWKYKFGLDTWLKVWHSNSNPKLIFSYYLEAIEDMEAMPLVTQSDPGSENFGIANGHTFLQHWHDPSLKGTLQHHWMREKKNIKPEITWSQLQCRFTPGFENILDHGINEDWYHPDNTLEVLVFCWVFIPCRSNKILPHGVPNDICLNPSEYGVLDFKVSRTLFSPPDHPVFELVPKSFSNIVSAIYIQHNSPAITRHNIWDELMPGLQELEGGMENRMSDGSYYMGGVNNGQGMVSSNHLLVFSS